MQVGQAVIQIAASKGFKTINFIRDRLEVRSFFIRTIAKMVDRDNVESLKVHLRALGATHVATYDELTDRAFKATFSSLTQGKVGSSLSRVGPYLTVLSGRQAGP